MANFLKSLFVKGVEIDPAGATSDQVLKYNGTKFVPGTSSTVGSIDDLSDVNAPTPSDGDILTYVGGEVNQWVDVSIAGPLGFASIDDLSDVVITTPEEFQSLVYNGTNWVNQYSSVVTYVRNAESTTLTTGTVVYLFGATGDHASVKRADNDSDTTSSKTIGLVGASIAASQNGPVITRGYVDGIDLSTGYAAGDILWLGEDGAFTKTKPVSPEHLVFIGVVVRATNNGIVYVATQNGYELDELHDVYLNPATLTNGDVIRYNSSTDIWENSAGSYIVSVTAPVSPSANDVWFNSDNGRTYIYYNDGNTSQWVEFGNANTGPTGATGATGATSPPSYLPMGSGIVYQPPYRQVSSLTNPTANRLFAMPIYISTALTATTLSVNTVTLTTAGTARLGIYNSGTNGVPSSLLVDAGTISYTASATTYSVTISTPLSVGWYWLAIVVQAGASTWLGCGETLLSPSVTQRSFAANSGNVVTGYYTDSVTGSLPSTPSWTASNSGMIQMKVALS